jgi:acyl-CoA synthetase (AMP-forming)/AMP-acid ligase II
VSRLVQVLQSRSAEQPDDVAYLFLKDGVSVGHLTYGALDRRACGVAAAVRDTGSSGRALLLYPSGLEFVTAFFGCLYAGLTPVPLFPPRRHRPDARIAAIVADCEPSLALTTAEVLSDSDQRLAMQPEMRSLRWLATDSLEDDTVELADTAWAGGDDLAYLQYTSGSTSSPKGVMVSHENLMHALDDLDRGARHDHDSVMVTWLPLFHDMGLIYGMLQPLHGGFPCYMMDPAAFLQSPIRWLEAISRYRGTHSAAPNFAYDLCVRSVTQAEKAQLELRSWSTAYNAAEPVREDTMRAFAGTFGQCGFEPRAFCPAYGLAESTLKVTAVSRGEGRKVIVLAGTELASGRVREAIESDDDARVLVGCGRSAVDTRVVIVDPETRTECRPDVVGEIWVSGPSVATGYWRRPRETDETFGARLAEPDECPFLRTGDLGFVRDSNLFITGRLKDMIIIRGLN